MKNMDSLTRIGFAILCLAVASLVVDSLPAMPEFVHPLIGGIALACALLGLLFLFNRNKRD